MYKQCKLQRDNEIQTSWISEDLAVLGQYVKLKEDDVWDIGWEVKEVYEPAKPYQYVRERGQDYKKTRKASDI